MPAVLGIHHVAVGVDDVDAAVAFYTGHLGFTIRDDRPDVGMAGAWLQLGDHQVHLFQDSAPPPRRQHFALLVRDLDAMVAQLRAGGVEVSDTSEFGPARQAFTHDPAGNAIELHERVAPA